MFIHIGFQRRKAGIRHIARIHAKRCDDRTGAVLFHPRRMGFKFYGIIAGTADKSFRRHTEINILNNVDILFRVQTVHFQNVFKDHLGHTAGPAADNRFPL